MKPLHATRAIFFIFLSTVPALSHAQSAGAQYYVSQGGNDSGPGSYYQPWRTIQKAMNSATPGSTVNIGAGTYTERLVLNVSGTPGNYITFQPYGFTGLAADGTPGGASIANNGYKPCAGDQVIIDFSSLGTVTDHIPFLDINGASYVRIQGLTFQNFTCNGAYQLGVQIAGGSHDVQILDNRFLNNQNIHGVLDGTSALLHFYIWASNNVIVSGNEFGYIVSCSSECLSVCSPGAVNTVVQSNYVHDTDSVGITIADGANQTTINGNLLERISEKSDGSFWYGRPCNAVYVDGGNTIMIERNLVRSSGWAYTALSEPGEPVTHDIVFRDNIAYGNAEAGIMLGNWYSNTDGSILYNVWVLNNTLYGNGYGFAIRPYTSGTVLWENNILASNLRSIGNALNWPVGVMDYNLYYGGGVGPDIEKVTSDPLFTNPNASVPNLSLQPSSPAINAGNPSFVPASDETDFAGNPRVVGGRVDIGAYEYQ